MSKRELQHMDPANVLESGSIRISRSGSAGQHHDPHGGENCKGSVQPPLSPVISLASDLELSPPPDWVFQECTPQGGGSFCETPVDEGRFRVWRGETFRALPHKRDVSSDESLEEADGTLTKLDIDLRQEIDRYVNDLNKDLDWPSNIDTEHRRIMARIGQCNKKALDAHDIELVKDMEAAKALITSARDQWHIRTKGEVYTPVQRDRVTIAHDQGAIMDSYVPSVSTHPAPKQHNAPQQVRFKDREQEENYHLSRMEGLFIALHYPNQMLIASTPWLYKWKPRLKKDNYIMQFRVKSITVVNRRDQFRSPCIDDRTGYDQYVRNSIMKEQGCKPLYWKSKLDIAECNSEGIFKGRHF